MLVLKAPAGFRLRFDELAFAPGGDALAAAPSWGVTLWTSFADGARAEAVPLGDGVASQRLAFAPDGRTLFAGSDLLLAVDLASRVIRRVPLDRWHRLGFGVSPDGARLIVSERLGGTVGGAEGTRLTCRPTDDLDRPTWQLITRADVLLPPVFPPGSDRFVQLESTHELMAERWAPRVVVRTLDTGAVLTETDLLPVPDYPDQAALSPDGLTLVVRLRDRIYANLIGAAGAAEVIANPSRKHFTGIAFHPSGRYLAATSNDKTVKLYDTTSWDLTRTFTWDIGRVRSVAFSPDGTLAAAGSDTGKVVVWDVDL
ncbi:WD domain, G-beta repeat [Gemmata obscuriglobus]|uniref:Uncharacterized protein n=1 Tax=Gemmata obscuriglobus TaxID=114 RepID=A0A2Z3H3X7_9BACT|nr:WD40 repeat domain-containing protein [Gemmata obscuriglobus]AWM41489.1 hypothetical protein C1280_33810 [Gemmata obscuriglobus]QEG32602.1 WD domain, G-beta repeat [Gemmata obscuriglobus]VTS11958.1 nacht and wd40 domain protein : Uncultured bacterium genome assembly Metasoil_fosmids_resub OS=uncultured bacterium PE=4 SV=1: WD40: WD40 [Gemmata obscuriglobus UQM 2246]